MSIAERKRIAIQKLEEKEKAKKEAENKSDNKNDDPQILTKTDHKKRFKRCNRVKR